MANIWRKSNYIKAERDMSNILGYYSIKLLDSSATLVISHNFKRKAKSERISPQSPEQQEHRGGR